jgi:hypothetical protein
MGFYFRKSAKLGPFRLNFSKSGIGMSVGVKGMRVGKGPRGNYIHMTGPMGIQYRQSLNNNPRTVKQPAPEPERIGQTFSNVKEIESVDADLMRDASFEDILDEINKKHRLPRLWVIDLWAVIAIVIIGIIIGEAALSVFIVFALVLFFAAPLFVYIDGRRKTTYLIYDIDQYHEDRIQKFYDAFNELKICSKKWFVSHTAELNAMESKRNSGAKNAIQRFPTNIADRVPKYIKTNVITPSIPVGKQTLYFFPDRILVVEKKKVGTVNYADLKIEYENNPTLENESVPPDAQAIDRAWKYANKNGGPDRRYKDNVQFPVCNYSGIAFTSASGLNERIQLSRPHIGANLAAALKNYVTVAP